MDSNFWEYREEDKLMQEELEATLIIRTERREGSYLTDGHWYSAMIVNGLGERVDTCTHRHRLRHVAQICGEMMVDKRKAQI